MVTKEDLQKRFEQAVRLAAAGADKVPDGLSFGPPVILWRRYHDGRETEETWPLWIAELTMAEIVHSEPLVCRAKIVRRNKVIRRTAKQNYFLLANKMAAMAPIHQKPRRGQPVLFPDHAPIMMEAA